jgi:hypothetical protein
MFREHWHEPRFWAWWVRKRVPVPVRWTLGYISVLAVLGAGFLAADRLSQVDAGGQTPFATGVVKPPGSGRVVTRPVVRYVPVVRKTDITVAGKKRVVTRTLLVPTVRTETATITNQAMVVSHNTSTVVKVVVETLPVTVEQTTIQATTIVSTQTPPGQTVTVTHTVTQPAAVLPPVTVTQFALTVTLPSTTVAITIPGTGT